MPRRSPEALERRRAYCRQYSREKYAELKQMHLCFKCYSRVWSSVYGKKTCKRCRISNASEARRNRGAYRNRKRKGLCPRCSGHKGTKEYGFVYCRTCRAYLAERKRKAKIHAQPQV